MEMEPMTAGGLLWPLAHTHTARSELEMSLPSKMDGNVLLMNDNHFFYHENGTEGIGFSEECRAIHRKRVDGVSFRRGQD